MSNNIFANTNNSEIRKNIDNLKFIYLNDENEDLNTNIKEKEIVNN